MRDPLLPGPGIKDSPSDDAARLLAAASDLASARELSRIMEVVRAAARDLTRADGVTFVLREGTSVHYADEDAIAPLWKGRRFPAEACISGWAMIHRQAVVIEDIYADERIPHDAYRPTFVKSLAMVPVRREDPVAAIGIYWARRHLATEREIGLVETLAGLTSVAFANVALVAELRRSVHARDEFLTVAAHELRTPLTPLALQIGWALRALEQGDVETTREAIVRAQQSVKRASDLVSEMLESSSVAERTVVPERASVDLAALARAAIARCKPVHRARIRLDGPDSLTGSWDRRLLAQVIEQLLSNALKFGSDRPVVVSLERIGNAARLTVVDDGPGIAIEDRDRIFERYARSAPTRQFGGLGLGLWLVRGYVEAHGGTVEVVSEPGKGAAFAVTLPGAEEERAPAGTAATGR